jgi:RNA polymerase sigma factor (sigma-70 family)
MSFPQTRLTLIQRLASGGNDDDWRRFMKDYWGPICRFALRWGAQNLIDAEDVASQTFAALWQNRLLRRWVSNRSAKLRSLLCAVVRNILATRSRVQASRQVVSTDLVEQVDQLRRVRDAQSDAFYAAWAEDVLQRSVESLAVEYYSESKGDYVRVFYGRLCQGLTIAQVAEALEITPAAVDHYYRNARSRLSKNLKSLVRRQVSRYAPPEESEGEFALEWQQLGQYLADHGGLDEAVRQAYHLLDPVQLKRHKGPGLTKALTHLTSLIRTSPDVISSKKTS